VNESIKDKPSEQEDDTVRSFKSLKEADGVEDSAEEEEPEDEESNPAASDNKRDTR